MNSLLHAKCLAPNFRLINRSLKTLPKLHNKSPDYYAVLGLNKSATKEQVKSAYFQRAKKFHPDNNSTIEARYMFQLAAEAYDVLSDESKKKDYDEFGYERVVYGGRAGGPERQRSYDDHDPEKLYHKIFGEASNFSQRDASWDDENDFGHSSHGRDFGTETRIQVKFEEAAKGTIYPLYMNLKVVCPKCSGTKSELGYTSNICPYCEGSGIETEKIGHVLSRRPCGYCHGTREFIKYKCIACEGTGRTIRKLVVRIHIPPGCENGQVLKVPIVKNDLGGHVLAQEDFFYAYISIEDEDECAFQRDELDIFSESDISISQAILGGKIFVEGLYRSKLEVRVPEFTDSFQSLVSHSNGISRSDGNVRGNHYVKVGIKVPQRLNRKQIEIWRKFAALEHADFEHGTVDGIETDFGHKYQTNVIEPSKIERNFNKKNSKLESSSAVKQFEEKFKNFFQNFE